MKPITRRIAQRQARLDPPHEVERKCTGESRVFKHALIVLAALTQSFAVASAAADTAGAHIDAGVGIVDITPAEPVTLAGSPSPKRASEIKTRLSARALVLSANGTKLAIVTLDTLKYPVGLVQQARAKIEHITGIPASHVIICASHTHSGPLWSYYKDQLVTPIAEAVALAARKLAPCTLGTAKGRADGLSQCRRVIKEGHAWNRWQLKPDEADRYPAESPHDPAFDVLALTGKDGKLRAVVYNFACHASSTRAPVISADFPGEVEKYLQDQVGYAVPTLFLTGACGDVNPTARATSDRFGAELGAEIVRCLGRLEPIARPSLAIECREFPMPGREQPEFREAEIARNWPAQLEHYRRTFAEMKTREKPFYPYFLTGIRISDDFAIVTNANELFCSIGLSIKSRSPFTHTMVAEQTNGAHGYVPTAKAFEGGSYETWFGEHSYLTKSAGEIIERESLNVLNRLKRAE